MHDEWSCARWRVNADRVLESDITNRYRSLLLGLCAHLVKYLVHTTTQEFLAAKHMSSVVSIKHFLQKRRSFHVRHRRIKSLRGCVTELGEPGTQQRRSTTCHRRTPTHHLTLRIGLWDVLPPAYCMRENESGCVWTLFGIAGKTASNL